MTLISDLLIEKEFQLKSNTHKLSYYQGLVYKYLQKAVPLILPLFIGSEAGDAYMSVTGGGVM